MYEQQVDFNQQYNDRMTDIKTQLKYLWFQTHPTPPPADLPSLPPPPPSDAPSSSYWPLLPPPY
ncbi:hypothetical protein Acr_10g0008000 [Actinidia rufa]|uniref:Uncharacterized protein n=1 Tax=Actinidia rufa TaxID=165716 RepID=A0A7J0F9R8_9ERIC|nr:hypothetical protein Acr_10g0008000 [Actinidia rufa]